MSKRYKKHSIEDRIKYIKMLKEGYSIDAGRNASTGRHKSVVHKAADDIGRSIPESREL